VKQFRDWLKAGLDHSRLDNGRILVSYRAIDSYIEQFRVVDSATQKAVALVESLND